MKLATWNVALPVAAARRTAIRAWIERISADVLVLTETHDGFNPGYAYSCSSAPGRDGLHRPSHRWVSIWSKHALEPIPTSDRERTAAARVHPEAGQAFLVYGMVLPSVGSTWRGFPARGGTAFGEALRLQSSDWTQLRRRFPDDEFFVLGDFNQDLVDRRYCGTKKTKALLSAALEAANLVAHTGGDSDPVRRNSPPFACIDHICGLKDSKWRAIVTSRWPDSPRPEKSLSDHFGIAVTLAKSDTFPIPKPRESD